MKLFWSVILLAITTISESSAQELRRDLHSNYDTAIKIYLTIDDGPSAASSYINSLSVSDSLKINVFLVGEQAYKSKEMRLAVEQYKANQFVEAGNHSYSHANAHYWKYYTNAKEVLGDFIMNKDTLALLNNTARLPGRNAWRIGSRRRFDLVDAVEAADLLAANKFRVFGWDLEWYCNATKPEIESAESIMDRIDKVIKQKSAMTTGHVVILCHEVMFTTQYGRGQLAGLLQKIKDRPDYQFEWLSRYP
ncbi:MAG: polysaccharide deacetylase family protein [Sediminibacterium sp.]